jgi:CheY-like chemotaxis protein
VKDRERRQQPTRRGQQAGGKPCGARAFANCRRRRPSLFRSAISYTLEAQQDLEVVAEAADGQEALELSRRLRPELVLMDLVMPVMDGVAAIRAIREELPDTFVLTALDEPEKLHDSLEADAAGYILKDAPVARIIDAVRRVLEGRSPLDEALAMRLFNLALQACWLLRSHGNWTGLVYFLCPILGSYSHLS